MQTQKYSNLTPWQPGQSGNPAGRKPGSKNMSTIVQELLDQYADNDILARSNFTELVQNTSTTYARAVVLATLHKALQGNMQAIIWLAEQQGKVIITQEAARQKPLVISTVAPRTNLQ